MIRLATDENLSRAILRGVPRRLPEADIVRIQDAGLSGAEDPAILQWAAEEGRVMLSHDVATMAYFASQRIEAGLPMSGLFEVPDHLPIGRAIEDIILLATCSLEGEWEDQVRYLPL